MKIAVTGANGLIGTALCSLLRAREHQVLKISRSLSRDPGSLNWDPESGKINRDQLESTDALVHLAGESVAQRWDGKSRAKIMESRKKGTRLISETISLLKLPPRVFVSASAIGFYGDRGSQALTEESSSGQGFLAEVCKVWEDESQPALKKGIRTVNLRTGIVLSKKGGALSQMLIPFSLGLGGILGDGRQYMSWISLSDLVEVIYFIICQDNITGPVNAVSPNPVTNSEFTRALGRAMGRPTVLSVPAFGARMLLGQMAQELLLSGAKVLPAKLQSAGFSYRYPSIDSALEHVLSDR